MLYTIEEKSKLYVYCTIFYKSKPGYVHFVLSFTNVDQRKSIFTNQCSKIISKVCIFLKYVYIR